MSLSTKIGDSDGSAIDDSCAVPAVAVIRNAHVFAPADLGLRDLLVLSGKVCAIAQPGMAVDPPIG